MKTIGMIGGFSWQSTLDYYKIINESIEKRTLNKHSGRILLDSVDLGDMSAFITNNDTPGLIAHLVHSAQRLENAGADMLLICANTMHFYAKEIQDSIRIPLVHIIDETIKEIKKKDLKLVGLLGTKFTMEKDFYKDRLLESEIRSLVPEAEDIEFINRTIFKELFRGVVVPESKTRMLKIIDSLAEQGAGGIILGCTEIPIMISQEDCEMTLFDTTKIHAQAAVELALG